jgi:hypothetical protein
MAGWSILGNFTRGDIPHTNFLLVNIPELPCQETQTALNGIKKNRNIILQRSDQHWSVYIDWKKKDILKWKFLHAPNEPVVIIEPQPVCLLQGNSSLPALFLEKRSAEQIQ